MFSSDSELQGAEPIFLHLLRPLLKPYTPTLDLLLDFVRMVGDVFFTMVTIPVNFVPTWWWSFMFSEENSDSETKGVRRSYVEATFTNTRGESHIQIRTLNQNIRTSRAVPSNGMTQAGPSHQIWYPPPSSYGDNEDDPPAAPAVNGTADSHAVQSNIAYRLEAARREQEQWRQYPAFPSAYPPTPVALSVSGLPTIPPARLSNILENPSQQDFRESLLPPSKPLGPSLSDECIPRAQSNASEDMALDPDSEDEDVFDVTLATPMVRARVGALLQLDREASISSTAASARSRSTALSTTDNVSSLRTQSSSESLSSATLSSSDLLPPSKKKRPLPHDSTTGSKLTSRLLEVPQGRKYGKVSGTTRTAQPFNEEDLGSKTSPADLENNQKPDHSKRRRIVAAQPRPTRVRAARYISSKTQSDASNIQPQSCESNELAGRRTGGAAFNGSAQVGLPPSNLTRPVTTRKPRPASQRTKEQGKENIR